MKKEALLFCAVVISLSRVQGRADTTSPESQSEVPSVCPADELHLRMEGVAYTVLEGANPELMRVEVLGVLENLNGPGRDMIVLRIQGAKPEYIGVVAGMNGSPVDSDGTIIGGDLMRRRADVEKYAPDWETKAKLCMVQIAGLATAGMLLGWLLWKEFVSLFMR